MIALEDLPIKLLKKLKLDRVLLSHRDDSDRPACAGKHTEFSFDRVNLSTNGTAAPVPPSVRQAAKMFCAGCPVRLECAADADATSEEGLWGGVYRVKTTRKRITVYERHDVLAS